MILYLTRHAQPEPNPSGPTAHRRLSELGVVQAKKLGSKLKSVGFGGSVLSSPYERCLDTAEEVCKATGCALEPVPQLGEIAREWILRYQGLRLDEIRALYSCCSSTAQLEWPWWPAGPETYDDVDVRVGEWLDHTLSACDTDLLVVGHGATVRSAYRHLVGDELEGNYNAVLHAIQIRPEPRVIFASDASHLDPGEVTNNKVIVA